MSIVHTNDNEQIELIRKTVAPAGTTNDELQLFMAYAHKTGLDPFSRQIYLSERRAQVNGNWVTTRRPEVTIDGFRLVAERTGQYAGQIGPFWCGTDGTWRDVWLADQPPAAAKLGVLRHDFKEPVWSVALYREYAQMTKEGRPNSMWAKYPSVMLAKCAESLALRRAFPRELSGLYTREEMPEERAEAAEAQKSVAQSKIAALSAPRPAVEVTVSPEVVQELAASLEMDRPAEPAAAAPKTRKKISALPFDILGQFRDLKSAMHAHDPADKVYYEVLGQFGYTKSSEIPDRDAAVAVYKSMKAAYVSLRTSFEHRGELSDLRKQMGEDRFWAFAGASGIDQEALDSLTGEALAKFVYALREESAQ
jgi:phage recombination protein Bet